jgi:hypothetical protein
LLLRVGDEPAQVLVAGVVLGEKDQVEGLAVGLAFLRGHRPRRHVRLDADDRLDALVLRCLVEGDRAVQRPVIGQRHRVHALRRCRVHQFGDPSEAVEQAELGVDVEVDEIVGREGHGRPVYRPPTGEVRPPVRPGRSTGTRVG